MENWSTAKFLWVCLAVIFTAMSAQDARNEEWNKAILWMATSLSIAYVITQKQSDVTKL